MYPKASDWRIKKSIRKMLEAASHDCAKQQRFAHRLQPSQQQLKLVAPTIHQAANCCTTCNNFRR